jgi:hypothetical protein
MSQPPVEAIEGLPLTALLHSTCGPCGVIPVPSRLQIAGQQQQMAGSRQAGTGQADTDWPERRARQLT